MFKHNQLLPKQKILPASFRVKHFLLDKVPYTSWIFYWLIAFRNRLPLFLHWFLVVAVPSALGFLFLRFGPNIHDTPSLVAGKLATINIITTFVILAAFWVMITQQMRRPVPRGEVI